MNDWIWHVIAAPAVAEPIQGQDFDFENWEVADRGWYGYSDFYAKGWEKAHDEMRQTHPQLFMSPMGITWEAAQKWLLDKGFNQELSELIKQATPGQPWRHEMTLETGLPDYQVFGIEKVQD